MSKNIDLNQKRASQELVRRHIGRVAELVYGEYLQEKKYPFFLLLHEIRTLVKHFSDYGLDDIDYLDRLVASFYSPHPSLFEPRHLQYMLSIVASEATNEGKVRGIEKFAKDHVSKELEN